LPHRSAVENMCRKKCQYSLETSVFSMSGKHFSGFLLQIFGFGHLA